MIIKLKGFSIAQLLIVIGIIAVVSTITFPSLASYTKSLQLKNSTKEVVAKLRLAQQYALTEQVKHSIRFTPLSTSYSLVKLSDPEIILETFNLNSQVNFTSISGLIANQAVYNSGGAVDFPGEIYLTHQSTGAQTLINAKPSGYVTWQIYQAP